jgi:multidrug resistance efflux pump
MPGGYRIPFSVPSNGKGTLAVVEDQPVEEAMRLLDLNDNRLGALAASSELDPKVRRALTEIAARRRAVAQQQSALQRLKEQRRQLVDDEARLRQNLAAVAGDPVLRKQLLDKFTATESGIDTATAAIAKASDALAAAQRELAAHVAELTL